MASDDRVPEALVEALDAEAGADAEREMLESEFGRQPVQPFEQDPPGARPLQVRLDHQSQHRAPVGTQR